MIIDHIGIVCQSISDGIDQWERLFGYTQMTKETINTRQLVKVVFMEKPGSIQVKLIQPINHKSPIYSFAQKGGGLHHLCFRTKDLIQQINQFSYLESMVRIIMPPQPGEAFDNENIAFALTSNNINIELIDTVKRANKL